MTRVREPIILDFIKKRVWLPDDEGYAQRKAELDAIRKRQKTGATNAQPPPDWRV